MDTVDTLNLLLRTSRDGEAGFRECARQVQSNQLRTVMHRRADDCARAAQELDAAIARHGGVADDTTREPGDGYRGWMIALGALGALGDPGDHAILAECERGEDLALRDYRAAIEQPLPEDVRQLVQRQFAGVRRNHDQVKALRDSLAAAEAQRSGRDLALSVLGSESYGFGARMGQRALALARRYPLRWLGIAIAGVVGCAVGWYALARQRPQGLGRWLRGLR